MCLFRFTCIAFFGEGISRQGVSSNPRKVQALTDIVPPKCKGRIAVIPGYIKIPKQIFTSNGRGISTPVKTDIGKNRLDVEWHILGPV